MVKQSLAAELLTSTDIFMPKPRSLQLVHRVLCLDKALDWKQILGQSNRYFLKDS